MLQIPLQMCFTGTPAGKAHFQSSKNTHSQSFPCVNLPRYCISLFLLQFNGNLRIVSMYSKMTLIWCGCPYLPQSEGLSYIVLYLMSYHWRQSMTFLIVTGCCLILVSEL